MKKALILGVTGSFGSSMCKALHATGWQIKALVRDPATIPPEVKEDAFRDIEIIAGDTASYNDVKAAAKDVSMLVYGVNPRNYRWSGRVTRWLDISATVAEALQLTLIFPGNVYNFDPADGPDFEPASRQQPITSKGILRQQMELRLQRATAHGAQVIVFRMGDFIAKGSRQSWLPELIKTKSDAVQLLSPGPRQLKHSWAYLPDAANQLALLAEQRQTLPAFNVFHFEGYQASVEDIAAAIRSETGSKVVIKAFPWWLLQPLRPFSSAIKGIFEMRYLWNVELNLKDNRLQQLLPEPVNHTPLTKALKKSGFL